MWELFAALEPFAIYEVSRVVGKAHGKVEKEAFLQAYQSYVSALKEGRLPEETPLKPSFSSVWTTRSEALYAMPVGEEKYLVKAIRPILQLQTHHLIFSALDRKFHSVAQGMDTIPWGLQFSYPQIFQDPQTKDFSKVVDNDEFPNTALFLALSRWVRQNTLPTPMIDQGKRVNLPVRLGKRCFSWIERHPRLIEKGFSIVCLSKSLPSAMNS